MPMAAAPPKEPPTAPPITPPFDLLPLDAGVVSAGGEVEVEVGVDVPVPVPVPVPVFVGDEEGVVDVDIVVGGAVVELVLDVDF